jgi:hypothetical protein
MNRLLQVLTTGWMLMFFSENVFWARYRSGEDSLANYAATWLAYSLIGYILLSLIRIFRVRNVWAIILVGAACGWLTEGVIVQTAYDHFPLQLSWTGLAWHALLSVLWVWYFLRSVLLKQNFSRVLLHAGLVGLFAGIWAISWWVEEPAAVVSPAAFAGYIFISSGLFIFNCWLFQSTSTHVFEPGKRVFPFVVGFFGLIFLFNLITTFHWVKLALPLLFALILWGLRRNRQMEILPDILETLSGKAPLSNYLALLAIPAAASAFYTLASILGWWIYTNQIVYLITVPVGFILFIASLMKLIRRPRTVSSQ